MGFPSTAFKPRCYQIYQIMHYTENITRILIHLKGLKSWHVLVIATIFHCLSRHVWNLSYPPSFNPNGFSSDGFIFPSLYDQVSARRLGQVIVTVPALGCPAVSRWDLAHPRLTSLPYWPVVGCRVGINPFWFLCSAHRIGGCGGVQTDICDSYPCRHVYA